MLFLGYGTEIKFHDCGAVLSPPFQILLQTLLRWSLWESLVGEQKLFSIISNDVIFETKQNVWQEKMWKCLFIAESWLVCTLAPEDRVTSTFEAQQHDHNPLLNSNIIGISC